jgi:hypothetical protein
LVTYIDYRFLLAALQVEALASGGFTDIKSLREAIEHLPVSLNDQYRRTLERIQGLSTREQDLACRAILLITYAPSTLGIDELLDALTIDMKTGSVERGRRTNKETLIGVCMGLVTIEKTRKTVQLIRMSLPVSMLRFRAQL